MYVVNLCELLIPAPGEKRKRAAARQPVEIAWKGVQTFEATGAA